MGQGASLPRAQWLLIGSLLLAIALANIAQPYPELAPLQHAPTVLFCLAAPWLLRRWPLSTGAVALIWLFLLLHTLGGRYIYSYVPYEGWLAAIGGEALGAFAGGRNAYDRLVHLMFGLLLTPVIAQAAQRHGGSGPGAAWLLGFALIGLASALYEVFEWLLTLVAAGETADYYNGQQGDVWDPQKDMALAQLGSGLACLDACLRRRLF
jgi:putative membrane protein